VLQQLRARRCTPSTSLLFFVRVPVQTVLSTPIVRFCRTLHAVRYTSKQAEVYSLTMLRIAVEAAFLDYCGSRHSLSAVAS